MRILRTYLLALLALVLFACGGKKVPEPNAASSAPKTLDSDPLALFPNGAIAIARVDSKALFAAGGSGAAVVKLAERFVPIGDEAGFSAARDLDALYIGSYSIQGVDGLSVLVGRFDAAKIQNAADKKTQLKGGGILVPSPYAGKTIYTANNVGFAVLSPKTVLGGTETAIRRALDRCRDGVPTRSLPALLTKTLETEGAHAALAADFSSQPVPAISVGPMRIPGTDGLRVARVLIDFKSPGLNVAGTLSYDSDEHAQSGAEGLRKLVKLLNTFSAVAPVPKLQEFEAKAQATDMTTKFAVDDKALKELLVALPDLLH
jgi:hypothetical protein